MAHNINTYYGRKPAWHKLGTVTGEYMTLNDVLTARGMAFDVSKRFAGKPVEAWGTFRDDNGASLAQIGKAFGGRNHATVLHAVRKMEAQLTDDCKAQLLAAARGEEMERVA